MIGVVADEFHLGPSQARQELDLDADLVFRIMHLRAYQRAKRAYEQADAEGRMKLMESSLVQQVVETDFELARETIEKRKKEQAERG